MNVKNFEQCIDRAVVARGWEYYQEGRVDLIEESADYCYSADVTGSDYYSVDIELNERGDIITTECDCPYTGGPYCKHVVAVLFALTEASRQSASGESVAGAKGHAQKSGSRKTSREQLAELLGDQPKERLVNLLLALAGEDPAIGHWLTAEAATGAGEREKWLAYMQRSIEKAMDKNGFINYHNCQYAVQGAYKVLERAQTAVDDGEFELAVDLILGVLQEMIDMLQFADDSAGDVGMVLEEAHSLLALAADDMPDEAGAACFSKVLQAAGDSCYNGWADERINLLHICAGLVTNIWQREQMESYLDDLLPAGRAGEYDSKYEAEAITLLRYQLIEQFDGQEQAAKFLYEHRHFAGLRELVIKEAMAVHDFARVEELALEGEKQDEAMPGLVLRWKKARFQAYRLAGQTAKLLAVGRELALRGDFTEYRQLKALYDKQEWAELYPDLLADIAKLSGYSNHKYTEILKEEQDWPRLWEFVQKNPRSIQDFYRQLLPGYREQVYELFAVFIRQDAARSSQRSHYRNVCSSLRLLAKIGGNQMAAGLVKQLLVEYPRRPAFREELLLVNVGEKT